MRFLIKAKPQCDRINKSIQDGTFGEKMQRILSELKPEAAYFMEEGGCRTAIIVVDVAEAKDMTTVAEPFFQMGGEVFLHPVMTAQDLANANLTELGKKWATA